jgi:competence protein ComEC
MPADATRIGFLEALLLGRRDADLRDLTDSFRRVGLAHLLSISGAHLGILLFLVWLVVRLIAPHPRVAAIVVLIVLAMFMLVVPARVPIVRAGIMATIFCVGVGTGRRITAMELIALAALVVLVWRPNDLFDAGFQLSFGVVAAMLLFGRPLGHRLWPEPEITPLGGSSSHWFARRAADYLAMNIVAYFVAAPVVAFHFQLISPLTILLSLMALPAVTAVLGLGYLKVLLGLLLPTFGTMLAGPLSWMSDIMTGLVEHAATWPGVAVPLARQPSAAWVLTCVLIAVFALRGAFAYRRATLVASAAVCVGWLWLGEAGLPAWLGPASESRGVAVRLNMFAVGDGSCFLLRTRDNDGRQRAIMFDCGSQAYLDAGLRSIGPALAELGVRRLDAMILSHADLDHFAGAVDVADRVLIARVLAPPQLIGEAAEHPHGTAAFLVEQLRQRSIPIEPVAQGWSQQWGDAELRLLWPPPDYEADRANDTSLVLSVRAAGRRILLNGDIQQQAITHLLARGESLDADVCDLPHHGSYVAASPAWLGAVSPRIVLQSSGRARLFNDQWAPLLDERGVQRLVSQEVGMVEVTVMRDGGIGWKSFRGGERADQLDDD